MKQITFNHDRKNGNITIQMPVELLVFALENSPHDNVKVLDKEKLADGIVEQLKNYHSQNSQELGITAFQEFMDTIMEEAVIDADEGVVKLKY